jgi:putative mycofactocin binding protein MftB
VPVTLTLESTCGLDPKVALRPEPFGALAYHYGTRRLVFLRHPDMVRVVESLSDRRTVRETLEHTGVDENRWPSFVSALSSLTESGIIRVH